MQQDRNTQQDFKLDTEQFAGRQNVKPNTVRSRVCRFGSYFGITPLRLKNGRLAWPDVQVVE